MFVRCGTKEEWRKNKHKYPDAKLLGTIKFYEDKN